MEFPPESHTVADVRNLVVRRVGVDVSHPAVLVASELAANAVVHASSPYEVRIDVDEPIRIEVSDRSSRLPIEKPARFGLRVIDQLSERWGAIQLDGGGKTVWAEVPR